MKNYTSYETNKPKRIYGKSNFEVMTTKYSFNIVIKIRQANKAVV